MSYLRLRNLCSAKGTGVRMKRAYRMRKTVFSSYISETILISRTQLNTHKTIKQHPNQILQLVNAVMNLINSCHKKKYKSPLNTLTSVEHPWPTKNAN